MRLAALEHRLARLEDWVAMPLTRPAQPPPMPPAIPVVSTPPPIPVAKVQPAEETTPAEPPPAAKAFEPPPPPKVQAQTLDLEAMIGQNWTSWVGGIVLLLGICFFVKYAWDQGWIRLSPSARVIAALALGTIVCGTGEWVWRRRMRGLAGTLHGTGVAILITTFFGANRYFEPPVLSRGAAFLGVAIAAGLGIYLALRINLLTIAILALIGAYLSPAILSSGEDKSLELLAYLAILAAAQWTISFFKGTRTRDDERPFQWLSLRWLALVGSFLWFIAWWAGMGERNDHHTLALAWLALIYAGFLAEIFFTLQVALRRFDPDAQPAATEIATLLQPPAGPRMADSGLATFSLMTTALTFGALYVVLQHEPRSVVAVITLALAAVQGVVALLTISRALMWSALLQAAGLVTLAVPLWFDKFSITIAWLALAAAVAALAWQFNLPAARGWAVVLLLLSVMRLMGFDSFSPNMRTVVATINDQPVTRWLLMAWSTAVLFHITAWMKPRPGNWPLVDEWIDDTHASKRTLGPIPLNYHSPRPMIQSDETGHDPLGVFLAAAGTVLFAAASGSRWNGPMLTLLAIVWLAPIVLLAVPGRRIEYPLHAALLIAAITLHWFGADNFNPLVRAWDNPSFNVSLPLLNWPALSALLLCAAIFQLARTRLLGEFDIPQACVVIGALLFAALTFESWRLVDYAANRGPGVDDPAMVKQMAMSVLWSIIGFAAVLLGFWKHIRPLRYAALALLAVTVTKIFIIDMQNVQAVWRILSFIALGSLLLGVSYLYHQQQARNT